MWIVLALLAALASAGTSLLLKRAVGQAGVVVTTVAFRAVGGVLLAIATTLAGPWPATTPTFWRAFAVVIPNEVGGMLCLSAALSLGDVSAVQPIMGFIPLLTMVGGALFFNEHPSALAMIGILLVVLGLYFVGLRKGSSALEPVRAFATSRASWIALLATLFWTVTSLTHKVGIAEVGAMPWATALTLGSAVTLGIRPEFVRLADSRQDALAAHIERMEFLGSEVILHARLEIGNAVLMGADIPSAQPMRSAYVTLTVDSAEETERIYRVLSEGGEIFMKMEQTFFAKRFAMLRDKFGTSWMLLHGNP